MSITTKSVTEFKPFSEGRMVARIWTKIYTQAVLREVKNKGYEVKKEHGMYKVFMDEILVMQAMIGGRGYLVRVNENLFQGN